MRKLTPLLTLLALHASLTLSANCAYAETNDGHEKNGADTENSATNSPDKKTTQPTGDLELKPKELSSRERRAENQYLVAIDLSVADLIIPGKKGATFAWTTSAASSWELEYLTASLVAPAVIGNLGEISDTRISLINRSFAERNSFNLFYGLSYFSMNMHLGSAIISSMTTIPDMDLLTVNSLGAVIGMGNRWTLPYGITLGVDWISWSQPLFVTKREDQISKYITDAASRDLVDKALTVAQRMPRFAFLKLQVGYSF